MQKRRKRGTPGVLAGLWEKKRRGGDILTACGEEVGTEWDTTISVCFLLTQFALSKVIVKCTRDRDVDLITSPALVLTRVYTKMIELAPFVCQFLKLS